MLLYLSDWSAVRFRGEDRLEWLQGQVTQDVLIQRDSLFCWLEPSGRCLTFGGLRFTPDSVDVLVPAPTVPRVLQRVQEMVVMEDVEAAPLEGRVAFAAPFDLILSEETEEPDIPAEAHLLERGFPLWGIDITERSIPFDLGDAFVEATVCPNKGCYVGQEIVARMRSRGQKPRDWVGLILDAPVEPGSAVEGFGTVTRCALSPTLGCIASASISKMRLDDGEIVAVTTKNGRVQAEVRHMPLLRG